MDEGKKKINRYFDSLTRKSIELSKDLLAEFNKDEINHKKIKSLFKEIEQVQNRKKSVLIKRNFLSRDRFKRSINE